MRILRRRTLAMAAGVAALAATVVGCHVQADLVCQRYSLRNHVAVQSYWSTQTDRYVCLSVNQVTGSRDPFYVYEIRRSNGDIDFIRREN
jgi:hypothetical protein